MLYNDGRIYRASEGPQNGVAWPVPICPTLVPRRNGTGNSLILLVLWPFSGSSHEFLKHLAPHNWTKGDRWRKRHSVAPFQGANFWATFSQGGGRSGLTLGYVVCHLRRQRRPSFQTPGVPGSRGAVARVRTAWGSGRVNQMQKSEWWMMNSLFNYCTPSLFHSFTLHPPATAGGSEPDEFRLPNSEVWLLTLFQRAQV